MARVDRLAFNEQRTTDGSSSAKCNRENNPRTESFFVPVAIKRMEFR